VNKSVLADLAWFVSFLLLWALLTTFWRTWWVVALLPLFSIALLGVSEVLHQAVHGNLWGRAWWANEALGRIVGALFGVSFHAYRRWHLRHHQTANTPEDPERAIYAAVAYTWRAEAWEHMRGARKVLRIPGILGVSGQLFFAEVGGSDAVVRGMQIGIPVFFAALGYLEGLSLLAIAAKVIVSWYLPLKLFQVFDFFLTQSEHYGAELTKDSSVAAQYRQSWNLRVPAFVELMLFRRNVHAEHHLRPGTHWSVIHARKDGRVLDWREYLRAWWEHGPRTA
jgi:fatty acid desaturase